MEKKQFKAESQRLLDLMINSIYTHREIFLREIISNASDAIDKLAYTALTDEKVGIARDQFAITITRDKENRTLTVSDNGIGMSLEEMEENLGTIAKSGSLGFKQAMEKKEDIDIIGQFGVGFYSAFMVASEVTVISKKYGADKAYKWVSNGTDGYSVEEAQRDTAGTDVIMVLKADTEEDTYSQYLEEYEIRNLITKYSDYIRYPIRMEVEKSRKKEDSPEDKPEYESYTEVETLNSMVPLWQKNKKDVTEEEYNTFYRDKFYDFNKPLRVIHFSAEGQVSFKALLYIPSKAPYDFYTKDFKRGLQLYSSGVMIMENCEDLLPEHFRFVRGVVDSQDLSLNISREMLQHNRQLTIIARNIEKKIKSELKSMLENEREKYEEFYAAFGRQLKYGTVSDYGAHKDSCQDLLLFYSHKQGKLISLKEYVDAMPEGQEKIYFAPGENKELLAKLPQVTLLDGKGYDTLLFTEDVDEFVPQTLMTYQEKSFCNVSTEDLGLQSEEEKKAAQEEAEEKKGFLTFVKDSLGDQVKEVRLNKNLGSCPVAMVPDAGMSFEMEKYMKRVNPEFSFPSARILELNPDNDIIRQLQETMTADPVKAKDLAQLLCFQAQLMAQLPLDDPYAYTELVCKLVR
ncbi:molecular chaperone HtpG [Pseudoflavonifractor sp. MSJ-30]|uniref:molecular chaperone HtpG n=1 Tax=Pseudoflavonifractor sp. MSJ-30 TaxID=2841525 RepID=UPI001C0F4B50|nr:molecular chaperone HtpG [Pseudoflavonifractor sp. MSJ-30]MBU5452326.1 molecular chaperone HtpG [Pseudoflavonifractor sp. MSJ-30]